MNHALLAYADIRKELKQQTLPELDELINRVLAENENLVAVDIGIIINLLKKDYETEEQLRALQAAGRFVRPLKERLALFLN